MDHTSGRCTFYDRPEKASKRIFKRLRSAVIEDAKPKGKESDIIKLWNYSRYTICIVHFTHLPAQFTEMYKNAIIGLDMKDDLERSNVINWCRTAKPLYPLKTTGDGNCLLHAVSLSLWGVEDSDLFLRRLLYLNIVTDEKGMFKKRWLVSQRQFLASQRFSVGMNTEDYTGEWEKVIKATEDLTRQGNTGHPYTCLESIHLYVLANLLQRPIIVLADHIARNVYGQSLQESEIGGIYLPLETPSTDCHKNPIVIGYNLNHFAPLVFEESDLGMTDSMQVVPLLSSELNSLAVHYLLVDEEPNAQQYIFQYLSVKEVVYTGMDGPLAIPAAQVKHEPLPKEMNIMEAYRADCENIYFKLTDEDVSRNRQPFGFEYRNRDIVARKTARGQNHINIMPNNAVNIVQGEFNVGPINTNRPRESGKENICRAMGCNMHGSKETGGYCSKCFKKGTLQYHKQEEVIRRQKEKEGKPPPVVNQPYLSMMEEKCITGCGFQCSRLTHPYCHDCKQKFEEPIHQPAIREMEPNEVLGSMLPDICITEKCTYRCSKATRPHCHQCYNKIIQLERNTQPTAPPQSMPYSAEAGPRISLSGQPVREVGNTEDQRLRITSQDETAVVNIQGANAGHHISVTSPPRGKYTPMEISEPGQGNEGQLSKKCKVAECENKAIKGNNGLCDSCYHTSVFVRGIATSPVSPSDQQMTALIEKLEPKTCRTSGCNELSKAGFDQCIQCFLKDGTLPSTRDNTKSEQMPLNIVSQENEKILNSSSNTNQHLGDLQPEAVVPSAIILQTRREEEYGEKQKCVTEGCEGMHLNNEFGLCDKCFVRKKSDLELSNTFPSWGPEEPTQEELKKLNPLITSSQQKTHCKSPFCDEMIYPPREYCEDCWSALQTARAKKAMKEDQESGSRNQALCKAEGCKFSGNPKLNGYCSQCYKGKAGGQNNSAPLRTAWKVMAEASQKKYDSAPLPQKQPVFSDKKCVEPNCTLFGDPSQDNRCSQHYRSPVSLHPQRGQRNLDVVSFRESRHKAEQEVDPFTSVFRKVEGNIKSRVLCKSNLSRGCQNYGNAKNKGYCNSCYATIKQREINQQLALAGGNRFG